jgi:hypothetical protein
MRKLARAPKVKPRRRTRWWVVGGLAAVAVIATAILGTRSLALSGRPRAYPMLAVSPDLKDFGEVRRGAGKLEAVFTLRSTGNAPLTISRIVPT